MTGLTYFYVAAKYGPREWRWIWCDKLYKETRSQDEVVRDAAAKGHDVSYCELYTGGVPKKTGEKIRAAVYKEVDKVVSVRNYYDIELEVNTRIVLCSRKTSQNKQ